VRSVSIIRLKQYFWVYKGLVRGLCFWYIKVEQEKLWCFIQVRPEMTTYSDEIVTLFTLLPLHSYWSFIDLLRCSLETSCEIENNWEVFLCV